MILAEPDPRSRPDAAFIEAIRRRFPIEPEMDRVLTRKMRLREGPAYTPVPLTRIVDGIRSLIASEHAGEFSVRNARWLTGGASKIQVAFELDWSGVDGGARRVTPMVLRMEPPESVVETSRRREFEVLKAMQGIVPVPPCHWVDADGRHLPYPALIYGFVEGVAKPTKQASTQVTGIGLNYGPELRAKLGPQFLEQLGRIHLAGADVQAKLESFAPAEIGSNAAVVRQVNWWRRVWEEDRAEDEPLMSTAAAWLVRNAPPIDRISVVHGDARGGNIMFDEETGRITAWLDWELAYLGDRHQDLAWSMMDVFRHVAENGRDELISGFLPMEAYIETYEKASGLSVDPRRLAYYRVLCSFVSAAICMGTGYRVARGGKTHQDVVCAWLAMIGHTVMEQMRATLEEVA
jgi:aminoglycoside phosphotransferase (APT) family kinase protein